MRTTFAVARRHRKNRLLRKLKGYREDSRSSTVRGETLLIKKSTHEFRSRKLKKRNMRSLFIVRINAALREMYDLSYSRFINMMNKFDGIKLTRKILQEMCFNDLESFRTYTCAVIESHKKL